MIQTRVDMIDGRAYMARVSFKEVKNARVTYVVRDESESLTFTGDFNESQVRKHVMKAWIGEDATDESMRLIRAALNSGVVEKWIDLV